MGSIANGTGRAIAVAGSIADLVDEARSLGYDGIEVTRLAGRRDFRAVSYSPRGFRVEAIGNSEVAAAKSLVRTIKR